MTRRMLVCLLCAQDVGRLSVVQYLAHAFIHGFFFAVLDVPGLAS